MRNMKHDNKHAQRGSQNAQLPPTLVEWGIIHDKYFSLVPPTFAAW